MTTSTAALSAAIEAVGNRAFSGRLATLCAGNKWTMADAARHLGLDRHKVWSYVRGHREPNLKALQSMANKLTKNELHWLITGS